MQFLWFIPNQGNGDGTVYREPLVILFVVWYFMTNILTILLCLSLFKNDSNQFLLCVFITGFGHGAMEHLDIFANDYSLYSRNNFVFSFYVIWGAIICGVCTSTLYIIDLQLCTFHFLWMHF